MAPVKPEICVYPDPEKVSEAVAERIVRIAHHAVSKKGRFTLALTGGRTPQLLFNRFASHYSDKMPWASIHVFWGDERCVPKEHDDSNYNLAHQTFLSKVAIPPQNIHRIQTEKTSPEDAAQSYEKILQEFFVATENEPGITFDLTLLGVGKDGHTASLFPSAPALEEELRWAVAVDAPASVSPPKRITLTYPVINRSERIFFLVTGTEKIQVVRSIFQNLESAKRIYPVARISALKKMIWFLDKNAMNDISSIS